jgi:hypothetical protein
MNAVLAIIANGIRRSTRDDKSRAIFVVGLWLSLLTDPIGLDGAL